MGGEKRKNDGSCNGRRGSPPRGRGKAAAPVWRRWYARITPAWAGKSPYPRFFLAIHRDHPRVGGEKSCPSPAPIGTLGSPPRGRGKARVTPAIGSIIRITPAWAGKSGTKIVDGVAKKDHPRVGGEKWKREPGASRERGSPPRGRGKAVASNVALTHTGITPAWAGKRQSYQCFQPPFGDHPRVGGEKFSGGGGARGR